MEFRVAHNSLHDPGCAVGAHTGKHVRVSSSDPFCGIETANLCMLYCNPFPHCKSSTHPPLTLRCLALNLWPFPLQRPYLLQAKTSYTQIGVFSLATYPYSFKLFWSPIVDSLYSRRFGRRKTWIVPIQTTTAVILFLWADWLQEQVEVI